MADRHASRPVCFRPPEADRAWLLAFAEQTGRAVNVILTEALAEYRQQHNRDLEATDSRQ